MKRNVWQNKRSAINDRSAKKPPRNLRRLFCWGDRLGSALKNNLANLVYTTLYRVNINSSDTRGGERPGKTMKKIHAISLTHFDETFDSHEIIASWGIRQKVESGVRFENMGVWYDKQENVVYSFNKSNLKKAWAIIKEEVINVSKALNMYKNDEKTIEALFAAPIKTI